jgi:NMD protein affecting ribosome stability and mRNA decay
METNNFLFNIQKLCVLEEKLYDIINTLNDCEKVADGTDISFSNLKGDCETHLKHVQKIHMNFFHSMCKHEFIDDYIDTGPESSKKITYCSHCGYTK